MTEEKKTLSLGGTTSAPATPPASKGTLSLKGNAPSGQQVITQTLARGQSRGVAIEVRKKRGAGAQTTTEQDQTNSPDQTKRNDPHLTNEERDARERALV